MFGFSLLDLTACSFVFGWPKRNARPLRITISVWGSWVNIRVNRYPPR